ncbi:MAG: hypothetical protein GMKNLPBB_00193 [Myxococcota bacterium]|nr:hypothetical protein [Myxococcota bacterium]
MSNNPLITRLLQDKLIGQEQIKELVNIIRKTGMDVDSALADLRYPGEHDILHYLSSKYGCETLTINQLSEINPPQQVRGMIPKQLAYDHHIVPVEFDKRNWVLKVVTTKPRNPEAESAAKIASSVGKVIMVLAVPTAVEAMLRRVYQNDVGAFSTLNRSLSSDTAWFIKEYRAINNLSDDDTAPMETGNEVVGEMSHEPAPGSGRPRTNRPPVYQQEYDEALFGVAAADLRASQQSSDEPLILEEVASPAKKPLLPLEVVRPATAQQAVVVVSRPPSTSRATVEQAPLVEDVPDPNQGVDEVYLQTVATLIRHFEELDPLTKGHSDNVALMCMSIAEKMEMPNEQVSYLRLAAALHDLGKSVDHITLMSLQTVPEHKTMAREVLNAPLDIMGDVPLPAEVVQILNSIFENYDGSGIPTGRAGDRIPLGGRILSAVDSFFGLVERPPKSETPVSPDQALKVLKSWSGKLFDPLVIGHLEEEISHNEARERPPVRYVVLLAVGDDNLAHELEEFLPEEGVATERVRSIEEVENVLKSNSYSGVIASCDLAGEDGILISSILQESEKTADWPVVFLGPATDPMLIQRAFAAGAAEFITTPLDLSVAVQKMVEVLKDRGKEMTNETAKTVMLDPSQSRNVALTGELENMGLPKLLQILMRDRQSGQLLIERDGETAEIYLEEGKVVHAIYGDLRGVEAFESIVGWDHGTFNVDTNFLILERAIDIPTERLINESLKRYNARRQDLSTS